MTDSHDVYNSDLPQYGIVATEGNDGNIFLVLSVFTTCSSSQFYLSDLTEYKRIAKVISDGIIKAGNEAVKAQRRKDSGLIVVKGDAADAIVRDPERRFKRGPRSAS